jgi:signal transduction histidine kinase
MNVSLEDFRRKIIGKLGLGTGLVWISFAVLFQSLVLLLAQNQKDLALSRLSSALNAFVSGHEGRVAIIASNPEMRSFMRSGEEGRSQSMTSLLTLMSSLRNEDVVGVKLVDSLSQQTLASLGDSRGQVLAFDLCYIGDQLNAQFGRCSSSMLLFFDGSSTLTKLTSNIEQIVPCASCETPITHFLATTQFLRLSQQTNFPVHFGTSDAKLGTVQLFFVVISAMVVSLGLFFRYLVGKAIKQDIVEPLSLLLVHMEKGSAVDFSTNTSVAEVVALHRYNSAFSAIARTTQMLAHDVRKPFNLFRMTMDRVKSADTPEQMKAILNEAVPEVDRSLASVNGLIADVLNVGAEGQLELKPMRLAPVVDDVVDEVRKLHPKSRLDVKLDVPSELWVQADFTRIPRVFLNILSNAVEAVGAAGHPDAKLWVSAREVDGNCVEVRVGNEGSYIAPENLDKLFDLFFTSGKTGGTGLGLAIVKKIVTQHGGTVHCTSERNVDFPNGRVEFVFTLQMGIPVADVPFVSKVSETDFDGREFGTVGLISEPNAAVSVNPTAAVDTEEAQPKPEVIFLDDSPLARWAWENKLKARVSVRCFDGPKAFFEKLEKGSADTLDLRALHTIITDHYFAPEDRMTGIEFAQELRRLGFNGRILLASNGEFSSSELAGIVDKIVDKQPVEWDRLGV